MTNPHPPENEAELIALIRSIDVRAPEDLHRRTEALIAERAGRAVQPGTRRSRVPLRVAGALAVAAVIVLALVLGGAGDSPLSVHAVAATTLRESTLPAPHESRHERTSLTADVDGVSFPYWEERFGWRSSGARIDRIDGRLVRTVFYTDNRGRRVGYAILAGSPPPAIGGTVKWRKGTPYRLLIVNGNPTVVWLRAGHLCVVAGRGVSGATLLRLASWDDPATAA